MQLAWNGATINTALTELQKSFIREKKGIKTVISGRGNCTNFNRKLLEEGLIKNKDCYLFWSGKDQNNFYQNTDKFYLTDLKISQIDKFFDIEFQFTSRDYIK